MIKGINSDEISYCVNPLLFLSFFLRLQLFGGKTVHQDPFHLGALQSDTQQEAQELIRSLNAVNLSLNTYKGLGSLKLRNRDGMM